MSITCQAVFRCLDTNTDKTLTIVAASKELVLESAHRICNAAIPTELRLPEDDGFYQVIWTVENGWRKPSD